MQQLLFRSSSIIRAFFKRNKNVNIFKYTPFALNNKYLFRFSENLDLEDVEKKYAEYFSDIKEEEGKLILNPKTKKPSKLLKDIYTSSKDFTLQSLSELLQIEEDKLKKSFHLLLNSSAIMTSQIIKKDEHKEKNEKITFDQAELLCYEFNIRLLSNSSKLKWEQIPLRPPVITIMGHVDHGKTTLLDSLRNSNIAENEFGGITQKIGAFHIITKESKRITFIDTPGHEAFVNMRIRGADCTDFIILVISAVDGIQQQTLEVIKIAQKTKVPMIVAVNKIDIIGADPEAIEQELYEKYNLGLEALGGNIPSIHISAKFKKNLDLLEELLVFESELFDLRQEVDCPAEGFVIEARRSADDESKSCTVLIQKGTLKINDFVIIGSTLCKIKQIKDDKGVNLTEATPSFAVELAGLKDLPESGDVLFGVKDESIGKYIAEKRRARSEEERKKGETLQGDLSPKIKFENRREKRMFYSGNKEYIRKKIDNIQLELREEIEDLRSQKKEDLESVNIENLEEEIRIIESKIEENKKYVDQFVFDEESEIINLPIILKAGDKGTLETIQMLVSKISKQYPKIDLQIVSSGVGQINENDLKQAALFKAKILSMEGGINVEGVKLSKQMGVEISNFKIIYALIEELKNKLEELSRKDEMSLSIRGNAKVQNVFDVKIPKIGVKKIAGCYINSGKLNKKYLFKIKRDGVEVAKDLKLSNLKKFKEEVSEMKKGSECGLSFLDHDNIQVGDILECYEIEDKNKKVKKS